MNHRSCKKIQTPARMTRWISETSALTLSLPFKQVPNICCTLLCILTEIVGSDTTTSVAVLLLYYILKHQHVYAAIQKEVDDAFPTLSPGATFPPGSLEALPYLNAAIKEGVRLGTPFPGLPRVVPHEGLTIGDTFIPGNTIVGVPAWSQQTDESNFYPDPLEYRPERWLPDGLGPDSITCPSALMGFSFGKCIEHCS